MARNAISSSCCNIWVEDTPPIIVDQARKDVSNLNYVSVYWKLTKVSYQKKRSAQSIGTKETQLECKIPWGSTVFYLKQK